MEREETSKEKKRTKKRKEGSNDSQQNKEFIREYNQEDQLMLHLIHQANEIPFWY